MTRLPSVRCVKSRRVVASGSLDIKKVLDAEFAFASLVLIGDAWPAVKRITPPAGSNEGSHAKWSRAELCPKRGMQQIHLGFEDRSLNTLSQADPGLRHC